MKRIWGLCFALALPLVAGCEPAIGSLYCGDSCTSSLHCSGALVCYNGVCVPPQCNDCGVASCRYTIHSDRTCSFDVCEAP
jgi:hypothetical protein